MTASRGLLADAYASWLDCLSSCYHASRPKKNKTRRRLEKGDFTVYRDQPGFTPPPSFSPPRFESEKGLDAGVGGSPSSPPRGRSIGSRRSRRSGSVLVRKRFWSHGSSSSRRPLISAPTNFRHLNAEQFTFPQYVPARPRRPRSFRPLELSIYHPSNRISPIMPHLLWNHPDLARPEPAHAATGSFDSDGATLTHQRSISSSMSFHLPRRPVPSHSASPSWAANGPDDSSPPRIPRRSRRRAYTTPEVDMLVTRIASSVIERDILQAEINSIAERQSVYAGSIYAGSISSRPSTSHGYPVLEPPMPSIPALPAAAPSFAERLSFERPRTAPPRPMANNHAALAAANAYATAMVGQSAVVGQSDIYTLPSHMPPPPPESSRRFPLVSEHDRAYDDRPLAPPLPLVLRPPLRKKKSFSNVSTWLNPGQVAQGGSNGSVQMYSVTNAPLPVTDRDGFYQTVPPPPPAASSIYDGDGFGRRPSIETVTSYSTWVTAEGEDGKGPEDGYDDPPPVPALEEESPGAGSLATMETLAPSLMPPTPPRKNSIAAYIPPPNHVDIAKPRPQSVGVAF